MVIDSRGVFKPEVFLGEDYSVWRGLADGDGINGKYDRDGRNVFFHAIAFSEICLVGEFNGKSIAASGEEKLAYLRNQKEITLGRGAFLALWLDYQEKQKDSVLEWLWKNRQIKYLDFFGVVIRKPVEGLGPIRYIPTLKRINENKWEYSLSWLGFSWLNVFGSAVVSFDAPHLSLRSSEAMNLIQLR